MPTTTAQPLAPLMRRLDASAESCNVASHLPRMAAALPGQPAVIVTASRDHQGAAHHAQLNFHELETQSNRYANGLTSIGIHRGTRVLLMVRPGLEFIGLVFALFKMGAVPVLIDPGMGFRRLLECIRHVRPEALIGIPPAHAMRVIRQAAFETVKQAVTVGRRWFWGGPTLEQLASRADPKFEPAETRPDEIAAILFTSGSTGPAKGVVYKHGMFDAQVRAIREHYGISPGEIDLPTFPLFALFNPALGMTSVIPDMDPSRPGRVDPAKIVRAVRDHRVTNSFGSPALWDRVSRYCTEHGITLPTIRRVLIAGAPVPWRLVERMQRILHPGGDVHTPYGATEALPVASISGKELFPECAKRTRAGAGICVGRPLAGMDARVIRICDTGIENWLDGLSLPASEIGEIVVQGAVVTRQYFELPAADALSKIRDDESNWHRMGDVGYFDESGRLWFCGRKAHRVETATGTMFTIPCEAVFNEHPEVRRTALVGVGTRGRQTPVIVVELESGNTPRASRAATLRAELLGLGANNPLTRDIRHILFHRAFPVDVRHNAKIDREVLALWATPRVG